jgi:hypothetical protein
MLMTKHIFFVHTGRDNYHHIIVTRLCDGVQKYFFQCNGSQLGIEKFLSSMTDELTEGYFPRAGKKGADTDNWKFLGDNPNRLDAEHLARLNLNRRCLFNEISGRYEFKI